MTEELTHCLCLVMLDTTICPIAENRGSHIQAHVQAHLH
jgi:hypothetical protein